MNENVEPIVKEFLDAMGIAVDRIEHVPTPAHPLLTVHTPDSGVLIGRDGEHLRALNFILKRIVERRFGEEATQFLLDVNGYHKRSLEELEKRARLAADRVRLFGSEVSMEPMSSYERMIVHSLFSNDPDVSTGSQGEGNLRHVVIRKRIEGAAGEVESDSL